MAGGTGNDTIELLTREKARGSALQLMIILLTEEHRTGRLDVELPCGQGIIYEGDAEHLIRPQADPGGSGIPGSDGIYLLSQKKGLGSSPRWNRRLLYQQRHDLFFF